MTSHFSSAEGKDLSSMNSISSKNILQELKWNFRNFQKKKKSSSLGKEKKSKTGLQVGRKWKQRKVETSEGSKSMKSISKEGF